MNRRRDHEANMPSRKYDASLVIPTLIGASWLALAIAAIAQLGEMGHTLTQARAAQERTANVTETCQNATSAAARAN